MRYNKSEKRVMAELERISEGRSWSLQYERYNKVASVKTRWLANTFSPSGACIQGYGKTALQAVRQLKAKIGAQHVGA